MENYVICKCKQVSYFDVEDALHNSKTFSDVEKTFEEVQKYTHLYSAVSALIDVSENFDSVNREFLGLEPDYDDWDEETLFHPENIVVSSAPKAKEEKKVLTNVAPVEKDNTSSDDYLAEIAELRKKLNQKEMECKQLKSQFAAANSAKKETEQLLNKYENDRNELIALREFAYRLEQEVPEIQQTSVDEMKAAITEGMANFANDRPQNAQQFLRNFPGCENIKL